MDLTVKGNSNAYMLKAVERVEATDRYTVKVTLKEPFAWFLDMLASPMAVAIVAREVVDKFGDLKKPEAVIGIGPWMLENYRPSGGFALVRHPHYFVPGLPLIDRIEAFVDEDSASRTAAFLSGKYDLGTDNLGRDLWSRIVYGARVSMTVGFATILLATVMATAIGVTSGYFGGAYDLVVQRIVAAWMSFPYLVIILSVMAVLGPGLVNVILSLSVIIAAINSRVIRGATLEVAQHAHVEAARAIGCGHAHPPPSHPPQRGRHHRRPRDDRPRRRDPRRIGPVLTRLRGAPALPVVGRHALGVGSHLHVSRAVDGAVAGRGDLAGGLRLQHARRRPS